MRAKKLTAATAPNPAKDVLSADQAAALNAGTILGADGAVYSLASAGGYVTLTGPGTFVAMAGPCRVRGWITSVANGSITVFDALSATGTAFIPAEALTLGGRPIWGSGNAGEVDFVTGATVVLSGSGVVRFAVE